MIVHHIGSIASAVVPNLVGIVGAVALTVTNPGAESSASGWTVSSGVETPATGTNATPRTGSLMFSSGTATVGFFSQTLAIPSGSHFGIDNLAYQLSVDRYACCNLTGLGASFLQIDFIDAGGGFLDQVFTVAKTATQSTWTLQNEKVAVPAGTRSIKLTMWFSTPSSTVNKVYLDDISVSLLQVADTVKVDLSRTSAIFGSRKDAVAIRDVTAYPVLGGSLARVAVRDATSYFIVTP